MPEQQPNKQQQEIKVADNIPGAEYANAMQVSHNKDEFNLFFFNILGASGKVVAKIITNPGHFKRMLAALDDNLKKYEERFGKIEESEAPAKEIGFRG